MAFWDFLPWNQNNKKTYTTKDPFTGQPVLTMGDLGGGVLGAQADTNQWAGQKRIDAAKAAIANQQQLLKGSYNPGNYGGGGGSAYDPEYDAGQLDSFRNQIGTRRGVIDSLYSQIYGGLDRYAQESRNRIDSDLQRQTDTLNKQFLDTTNTTDNVFSARNSFNSSYRNKAQAGNKETYDTNLGDIGRARDDSYAQIGKTYQTKRASFDASKPQYDLGQYGSVSALKELFGNLGGVESNLKQSLAELGTNSDYINQLNAVAPKQNQGADMLKTRIDKLIGGQGTSGAKNEIIKGYVSDLPAKDQAYWLDYFYKTLGPARA